MQQSDADKPDADSVRSDILFTLAAMSAVNGQLQMALAHIRELELIEPEYPGIWRLKARIYELIGDREVAALCWEKGSDGFK